MNSMTHASLVSPTPTSRDISSREFGARDTPHGRYQQQPYFGQSVVPLGRRLATKAYLFEDMADEKGAYHHSEAAAYAMTDVPFFNGAGHVPFANGSGHYNVHQDQFRFSSGSQIQSKQEEYSNSNSGDSLSSAGANQFLTLPGANPLFSQDRMFLNSYSQHPTSQSLSSLGFTAINRNRENARSSHQDQRTSRASSVRLDAQLSEGIDDTNSADSKRPEFDSHSLWGSQGNPNGLALPENQDSEQLDI